MPSAGSYEFFFLCGFKPVLKIIKWFFPAEGELAHSIFGLLMKAGFRGRACMCGCVGVGVSEWNSFGRTNSPYRNPSPLNSDLRAQTRVYFKIPSSQQIAKALCAPHVCGGGRQEEVFLWKWLSLQFDSSPLSMYMVCISKALSGLWPVRNFRVSFWWHCNKQLPNRSEVYGKVPCKYIWPLPLCLALEPGPECSAGNRSGH